MATVTLLLNSQGDTSASSEQLLEFVYGELRQMARAKMAGEPAGLTFQATELVHDAWLRLSTRQAWQNRLHFFASAAEAMRRILIEQARRRNAQRRGAGAEHVPLEALDIAAPGTDDEVVAVGEALLSLEATDVQLATLVKLRYFTGLTMTEVADILDISEATAKRRWVYARAWLAEHVQGSRLS
jgi:RNA polymerase sigma factor (TIGR02999 family)